MVVTFKIPDLLLDKPQGLHVSELSKLSGCEEGKLARILRLLATKHCFTEGPSSVLVVACWLTFPQYDGMFSPITD